MKTWTLPKLERLNVTELTQTRGFGRHDDDKNERNDRRSRWNQGKKHCDRDDS